MRLIDADLLLSVMDKRFKEKKDIVPNNLAEGFMQMEKLIGTAYRLRCGSKGGGAGRTCRI